MVSFKVTQSALKCTMSPVNCCLYQSQTMPLTVRLNLTSPEGAKLENVALGDKTNQVKLTVQVEK